MPSEIPEAAPNITPFWLINHIASHPDVTDIKFRDGIMFLRTTKGDIDMTQPQYIQVSEK